MNPEAKAKRTAKFKKYLASAAWKAKRRAVFERDGFQCTATDRVQVALAFEGEVLNMGKPVDRRCEFVDESRRGAGLVCDHLTYARFGNENLDDLRTLCVPHDRRETVKHRANWSRS